MILAFAAFVLSAPAAAQRLSPEPRPGTVWVDDDFGPGTSGWGRTHFAAIAEGVLHVDAGGVVQVGAGMYPEALVLAKRVHLEGSPGATLVAVGQFMITIWAPGTSVRGLRFENDGGPNIAILVRGADHCTLVGNELTGSALDLQVWPYTDEVTGCEITDNRGIANLRVGVAGYGYPVRACRIERNQAGTIRMELGVDSRIAENDVDTLSSGVLGDGIQLEGCTHTEVRGNTVRSGEGGIMLGTTYGSTANLVIANHVTGPFYTGIGGRNAHDTVIRENVLTGEAFARGILLSYTDRAQVLQNRIELPSGSPGLFLVESESALLEENVLTGGGLVIRGVLPSEWNSHVVTGNTFEGRPIHYEAGTSGGGAPLDAGQVILAGCSDFTIEGILFPRGAPGVQLLACDSGVVHGCTFLEGGPSAVYAWGSAALDVSANAMLDAPAAMQEEPSTILMEHCSACRIRDNYLAFSAPLAAAGMELLYCDSFEIVGNTIANYGLALLYRYGPGGSVLHGNSFSAYGSVHDDCDNTWDDGLGSGNYWDDYAGVDGDGDGIGDTPHAISAGSADAYPLMSPPGGALLWSDRHVISAAAGGSTRFVLDAGRARAGQRYLVLGSASGTSPGTRFGGQHLPLNPDAYFLDLRVDPFAAGRVAFSGVLDANGRAVAELTLAPFDPALTGTTLHHAACVIVLDPMGSPNVHTLRVEASTNALPLHLVE